MQIMVKIQQYKQHGYSIICTHTQSHSYKQTQYLKTLHAHTHSYSSSTASHNHKHDSTSYRCCKNIKTLDCITNDTNHHVSSFLKGSLVLVMSLCGSEANSRVGKKKVCRNQCNLNILYVACDSVAQPVVMIFYMLHDSHIFRCWNSTHNFDQRQWRINANP